MDELMATPIAGTEGAFPDFFLVAFVAAGKLKKVSLLGGAAITLCEAVADRGGSWDTENTIVFAARSDSGLGWLK